MCFRHAGHTHLTDFSLDPGGTGAIIPCPLTEGFPGPSDGKEPACHAGDSGSIPGLGRSPGGEHGNPLQDSCLENPMDGGAWWATVHGVGHD